VRGYVYEMTTRRVTSSNRQLLKGIYWSLRGRSEGTPHHLKALIGFALSYFALWVWRQAGLTNRRVVAIGLVEHLGDIVAAEPISRAVRSLFPGSRIVWVCRRPYAQLPRQYPDIDRVLSVTCLTEWLFLRNTRLIDVALELHLHGRYCPLCGPWAAVSKDGLGSRIIDATYFNYGNLLAVCCLSAGIRPLQDGPMLTPGRAAGRTVDRLRLPVRFVVIHCAANDPVKEWKTEKWKQLVDRLTQTLCIDVVEVGLEPVVASAGAGAVRSLCGKLSILETAELIRRARLFVGIDSGPAHLANAVGTEGVILLGDYRGFKRYMPYSGDYQSGIRADLLYAGGPAAALEVETVVGAIAKRLRDSEFVL
jgi:heptosyltransferase-3